jgi:hypothetical protein
MSEEQWDQLDRVAEQVARDDLDAYRPLSREERLYVALAANRADLVNAGGDTIAEALERLGREWREALIERWRYRGNPLRVRSCDTAVLQTGIAALREALEPSPSTDVLRAHESARQLTLQTQRATTRRDELLATEGWLDYKGVATRARGAVLNSNGSEFASRLRREGRLLGAKIRGAFQHPSFQLGPDGQVLPEMAEVINVLPEDASGWATVFWFFQPCGHLSNQRPADVFQRDPRAVIAAAAKDFGRRDDAF